MPEVVIILLIVVAILAFALYGFVTALIQLFGGSKKSSTNEEHIQRWPGPATKKTPQDDVFGASKLLNTLYETNKVDDQEYEQARAFLEKHFAEDYKLCTRIEVTDFPETNEPFVIEDVEEPEEDGIVAAEVVQVVSASDATSQLAQTSQIQPTPPTQPTKLATAPWDLPDPPEPVPRKSFQEMLAAFMLDKNIRWGELASGILIVGSAVGLVISLRNELEDTIPYFSALLFLLITAAINAAGIYTLKKWKLRNTSRGTLLIGLLLIPLNFLAACILSHEDAHRRELTDPLLWVAIAVGLSAFSIMTWFSGKCLVRKGQLPLMFSIIGSAIGTLIINRAEGIDESTVVKLLLSVPLVLSFLFGTTVLFRQQWSRDRWPRRTTYRLFTFLGIAGFAFLNGAAMLVIRAEHNPPTWVALAPSFAVVALLTSWFGHIIWKGARGKDSKPMEMTGLSMMIFGLVIVAITWIISFSNPTVLLLNAILLTAGFLLYAYHRGEPALLIPGWLAFGSFVLCGFNLAAGRLPWDSFVNVSQLANVALSGSSGITLLLVGAGIVGMHSLHQPAKNAKRFKIVGLAGGGLVFSIGLLLAIAASFVHPGNLFDNLTATSLLGLASVLALGACLRLGAARTPVFKATDYSLPVVSAAAFVLLGFLAHAFGWNRWAANWLNELAFGINANWTLVFSIHAVVLSMVAATIYALSRSNSAEGESTSGNIISELARFACLTGLIGLSIGVFLVPQQSGLVTIVGAVLTLCCLVCAWSHQSKASVYHWMTAFTLLSAICVSIFVIELLTKTQWCPGVKAPRHWLVQTSALSIWFLTTLISSWLFSKSPRFKFFQIPRVLTVSIGGALAAFFVVFAATGLIFESNVELFADAMVPPLTLAGETNWSIAAVLLLFCALLLAAFKHPSSILGVAIVTVWAAAWALGALYFTDEKAVATGIRWLLPVGTAIGAACVAARTPFVAAWVTARNRAGLSGKSVWAKPVTQRLINLSLAIVVLVVMSISTIAIVQVMMFGGVEALGGPLKQTLFGDMKKDISYGIPVGIIVNTFLLYAISERRKWLATAGSLVFQYCVILSVILLFVSPHPKLATSWFVNILQAVSVGMTGYGFVWWWFYERIEGSAESSAVSEPTGGTRKKISQLEIHTLINGLLITALAVLVITRFFRFPLVSGDWINSVGGPLGVGAWGLYSVLVYLVFKDALRVAHRTSSWMWLACWTGLVLVGMVAALHDRVIADRVQYQPWATFNLIMWGAVIVSVIQIAMLILERRPLKSIVRQSNLPDSTDLFIKRTTSWSLRSDQVLPLLFACSVATLFTVKGMLFPVNFWIAFWAACSVVVVLTVGGFLRESGLLGLVSAGATGAATLLLIRMDPQSWFTERQPYEANVLGVALTAIGIIWCGFYVVRTVLLKKEVNSRVVWTSNLILVLCSTWLLLGSLAQLLMELENATTVTCLKNAWGIGLFVITAILGVLNLWNQSRKGLVTAGCLWWFGLTIFATAVLVNGTSGLHYATTIFSLGCAVAILGIFWALRNRWMPFLQKLAAPKLEKLEASLYTQLPVFGTIVAIIVIVGALAATLNQDVRMHRYLTAFSPFGLAIGFGCWSDQNRRRWVQLLSLALLTLGAMYVAWADLSLAEIRGDAGSMFVRAVLVLAAAMFVYGGVVSRFVKHHDSWLKSLRDMAVVTCSLALTCFTLLVVIEYFDFVPDVGCGMPVPEAIAVAVAVIGMAVGLIIIAVRPENDPFALSLQGRTAYVYVAQIVVALLIMHLYFTMPFLFRIGIKDYWPYIVMLVCFGGVGLSSWLEKRDLPVLGQPFFNTAAILPLLVAVAIWGIDSKADHSLVTLIVGLAYLMISYTHKSVVCGAAAVLFGNLSLWLFYDKFDGFSFQDHPQLWLIPPAVSVLIAAQLNRHKLTNSQLALIRYVCATVIYLSSTSEIFINGLGAKLWPPMVLALLSVGGIFAGIMLQVRAYLYLGAVFLLMAMVSMVSHAHQRLEHVWPWWAFGITLGIAILVMFGLFEKRKNDMKEVVDRLKQWEM